MKKQNFYSRPRMAKAALLLPIVISVFSVLSFGQKGSKATNHSKMVVDTMLPWSQRMAETVMDDYPQLIQIEGDKKFKWEYTYGLVASAFIDLWKKTGDKKYYTYCKAYYDSFVNDDGSVLTYKKTDYNIDRINPGKVLFDLYKQTGDDKYKKVIDTLRQQLREHPRTSTGGFWHKKIYPNQMWLDGTYMGAPFYARYGRDFNEPSDFDDVTNWLMAIEHVARDPKTGLLYHGWDESRKQKWSDPQTGCSPNFWGRGVGWYAMALVDILDYFPNDYAKRDSIIDIIQRLAKAITQVQDTKTGLWYQVLDQKDRKGNYIEGSASCMLTYFLLKSIKNGYINSGYMANAEKAYNGIIKDLIKVADNGLLTITPVCAVAGLGGNPYRDGSYEYYINEKKRDNDPKAVGPFIMASILYEEMVLKKTDENTKN